MERQLCSRPFPAPGHDLFEARQGLRDALLSWRSILPRTAHDLYADAFLQAGLPLLVFRTNQIPGADPRFSPVAPTALFGQLPLVPTLLGRLGDSLFPFRGGAGLVWGLVLGIGVVGIARTRGWRQGARIVPLIGEEVVFRGLLLPSPLEGLAPLATVPWIGVSVGLFVVWRGVRLGRRPEGGWIQVADRPALLQLTLLGGACALACLLSGSLGPPVVLRGLALMARGSGPATQRKGAPLPPPA
jgi:predicted Abi (CAAX) family protease